MRMPLWKTLNDELSETIGLHKVVEDVDLTTFITNCELLAVVREVKADQMCLATNDLCKLCSEVVSNDSLSQNVN